MGELRTFVHFELCFEAQPEVVGETPAQRKLSSKMSCLEQILPSFLLLSSSPLNGQKHRREQWITLFRPANATRRWWRGWTWCAFLDIQLKSTNFPAIVNTCKREPLQRESFLHQWHAAQVCLAMHTLCAFVLKHAFRYNGRAEDKNKQQRSLAFWHKASLSSPTGETYCCFRLPVKNVWARVSSGLERRLLFHTLQQCHFPVSVLPFPQFFLLPVPLPISFTPILYFLSLLSSPCAPLRLAILCKFCTLAADMLRHKGAHFGAKLGTCHRQKSCDWSLPL